MKPANASNKWTIEQDEQLRKMIASRAALSLLIVATKLQRSLIAVKGRVHFLKISRRITGPKAKRQPAVKIGLKAKK